MTSFGWLQRELLLAALGATISLTARTAFASCLMSDSCVCESQYPVGSEANPPTGVLVHIRATAVAPGLLQAELLEVAGPSNGFELESGDVLGRLGTTSTGAGSLITGAPCGNDRSAVVVGAELLAFYHPSEPDRSGGHLACEQFRSCAAARCGPIAMRSQCEQGCAAETEAICSADALLNGYFSWAVPWQPELDFGEGRRLAVSDLAVLFDVESCRAVFPVPPPTPCNDTGSCALASGKRSSRGVAAGLSSLVLCAGLGRLRRSRRRRGGV